MPFRPSFLLASALAVGSLAQVIPVPDMSGDIVCDGSIRPNYTECTDTLLPQTYDGATAGPGFGEGQTFTGEQCQIRVLKCGANTEGSFVVDGESMGGMYPLVENQCGSYPAGGVYRSGDACIYVDDPKNPFGAPPDKRSVEPKPASSAGKKRKDAARDLIKESQALVEGRQCDPPEGPCYKYTEQTFVTNVRGFEQKVCNNIVPKDSTCSESKAVTTEESFTVGAEISAGIKDIVDVGASFSTSASNSTTETITTTIKVNCEKGGYVVWYPLMEVSSGECGQGPEATCSGGCITDTIAQCEYRRPITASEGVLSGEYDVRCI